MTEPTVTWTGLVPSTTGRRNKRTGQPQSYRVVLLSDGTATCDCPGRIFARTRTDEGPESCKHIENARRIQGGDITPGPSLPPRTPTAGPTKGPAAQAEPDDFLSEFEDDALLDLPQVRHERRD